jgi:hypothetical protein
MEKILENIENCVIKNFDTKRIPNLFKGKVEKDSWRGAKENKYNFSGHYNKDDGSLLHIYCYVTEKRKVLSLRKMFIKKKFTEKLYIADLSITSSEGKIDYHINSNEYPMLCGLYKTLENHVKKTNHKTLYTINNIIKSDINLVNNNNITHNF